MACNPNRTSKDQPCASGTAPQTDSWSDPAEANQLGALISVRSM